MSRDAAKPKTDRDEEGRANKSTVASPMVPLEVIDKAIGTQIKVLLSNNKEFQGTLIGFDDFVNVVLRNVHEVDQNGVKSSVINKMLLNGAQIAMLCPA